MQKFEPDQLVLVREKLETVWRLTHYSHRIQGAARWSVTIDGKVWEPYNILPYAGNEHLLGTTGTPAPKWEPKPGELVAVCDSAEENWTVCIYEEKKDGMFWCRSTIYSSPEHWRFCEPLRKHFTVPEE